MPVLMSLLGFTGFLSRFTGLYRVLLCARGVLLGCTGFYWVLQGFAGF